MRLELFLAVINSRDLRVLEQLGRKLNILVSAGHFCDGYRLRFPSIKFRRPWVKFLMVDSGAQQFSKFTEYPYTTEYYVYFCNYVRADLAVSLDYPIDMFEWRGLEYDYRDLLRKTVENAIELYEFWENDVLKATPVLVIQGLEDEWFEECIDLYDEVGLLKKHKYWGIGSLCMSQYARAKKIIRVARMVRRRLGPDAHIHVFGPDMSS